MGGGREGVSVCITAENYCRCGLSINIFKDLRYVSFRGEGWGIDSRPRTKPLRTHSRTHTYTHTHTRARARAPLHTYR